MLADKALNDIDNETIFVLTNTCISLYGTQIKHCCPSDNSPEKEAHEFKLH